jgi:hypothetical protein
VSYTGWGQRPSDFSRPSWGGSPPDERSLVRRLLTWGLSAVALVGVAVVVMLAVDGDDEYDEQELAERSQQPVVHEARLIDDDRLELDVSGPPDADYCLESPSARATLAGRLCTSGHRGGHWYSVDDLEAADADELVGRELVVKAESRLDSGAALLSEPSEPVEIVDAR